MGQYRLLQNFKALVGTDFDFKTFIQPVIKFRCFNSNIEIQAPSFFFFVRPSLIMTCETTVFLVVCELHMWISLHHVLLPGHLLLVYLILKLWRHHIRICIDGLLLRIEILKTLVSIEHLIWIIRKVLAHLLLKLINLIAHYNIYYKNINL